MLNPLVPILGGVFGVFAYTLLLPHRDIYAEKAFIHTKEHVEELTELAKVSPRAQQALESLKRDFPASKQE